MSLPTTYKPLPEVYRKNSFTYTLLHRTERVALYEQADENGPVAFEVCRVLRHDDRTIGGNELPPAEFLPSTEQWGSQGWTLPALQAAMQRFNEQESRLTTSPSNPQH